MVDNLQVKKLRELTGVSVMECKRALENSGGDFEMAQNYLKEQGVKVADKKAERATRAGLVESYIHGNGRTGALVEIFCETDFVARNPIFKELVHDIAMQVVAFDPQDEAGLLSMPFLKDESVTVNDHIRSKIALLGENIKLGRFVRFRI